MSIFICWSGPRGKTIADAVALLLQGELSMSEGDVFVSGRIEKGTEWFESIIGQLQRATVGVVCLTRENLENPWLHFEAGALASRLAPQVVDGRVTDATGTPTANGNERRLFPLLHGVSVAQLKGPLTAYQATTTTRVEVGALLSSAARVLGKAHTGTVDEIRWSTFQNTLGAIALPKVRDLIPDFESLFQRKTFNEPLHHCADQAWLRRHDGVRYTRERLEAHLATVQAACPDDEKGLFEMLLAELDGYAMAMGNLLLVPTTFKLGKSGELDMEIGIRTCCEDRRLAIRSLAGRLLRPLDSPKREEAVRFMAAETNEERKMIVHRLEGAIRQQWERTWARTRGAAEHAAPWTQALAELTQDRQAAEFRGSSWDLDRVFYYLLVQYFQAAAIDSGRSAEGASKPTDSDYVCAARDVEMEVERFMSKAKGGSLMPLTYSLVALQALEVRDATANAETRHKIVGALNVCTDELGDVLRDPARGGTIARLLQDLRRCLGAVPREVDPREATVQRLPGP